MKRPESIVRNILGNLPKPTYDARIANQCKSVDIASDQWPDRHLLGLDESQFAAFKAAITQQLAIIQGPPGNLLFLPKLQIPIKYYLINIYRNRKDVRWTTNHSSTLTKRTQSQTKRQL